MHRQAALQAPPLSQLIELMQRYTCQKDDSSPGGTDPQRQGKQYQQDASKAARKHTVDYTDHAGHGEKALYPGGIHRLVAQRLLRIIMGGQDEVGLHLGAYSR